MQKVGKFDPKVNFIPNGLGKYIAFTTNNNLVFVQSMQFMNSILDALFKNFFDFKYLSQELSGDLLELVKHKGLYPYEYMSTFKKFFEYKFPDRCALFSFYKISALVNKTIHILLMFGIRLKRTQWVVIMIFI